jgi:hypothetical protein
LFRTPFVHWQQNFHAAVQYTLAIALSGCNNKLANPYQCHTGHAAIYGLVVPGLEDVSLMPDADVGSLASNASAQIEPSRPMLFVFRSGIGFQVFEGAPVLHEMRPISVICALAFQMDAIIHPASQSPSSDPTIPITLLAGRRLDLKEISELILSVPIRYKTISITRKMQQL